MKGLSKLGVGLAITAAATLAMSGCQSSKKSMSNETVKCGGLNACKGMTECKTANNACKGQNKCKGTGWVSMSSLECAKSGGTPL
jgi:hypothetical protein